MIQLGQRSAAALRYLWKFSALANHVHAGSAFDPDRNTLDVDPLADGFHYSTGEAVLVELAMTIACDGGKVLVIDLTRLDQPNREVAVEAIRLWLCGEREAVEA